MPFNVKEDKNACSASHPWACYNTDTGKVHGCHKTRQDAIKQQRALYANVPEARMSETTNVLAPLRFAEVTAGGSDLVWLEALPAKTWHTMSFGEVVITRETLDRMIQNFKNNVRRQEIATDYEHGLDPAKGTKASGWIRDVALRDDTLHVGVQFTEPAKQEIVNKEWKYFSLDWDRFWTDPETQHTYQDVITGGGLTNRPVAKGLMPINFSELFVEKEGAGVTTPTGESAAEETHDPDTEPDPNTNPDDSSEHGARIDPVPADEDGSTPNRADTVESEGGETVADENKPDDLDKQLREKLGLADDADIIKAVTDMHEEVKPLREAAAQFGERVAFAEAFPTEHTKLLRLEKVEQENNAVKFSEGFSKMKVGEDKKRLSSVALESLRSLHVKFSEGAAGITDVEDTLKTVLGEHGLVEYGERGSSVDDHDDTLTENANPRIAFAEKAKGIQMREFEKGNEIAFSEAVRIATKEHPDLAHAYKAHNPAA